MSEQLVGRFGWFVNWFGQWRDNQWRGHSQAGESRAAASYASESRDWLDAMTFDAANGRDEPPIESAATEHLREAVEQLSSHERHVLLLHVNGGMTYWEIAGQLGMAEQAVLSDLSRAYSRLRVGLSVDEIRGPHQ